MGICCGKREGADTLPKEPDKLLGSEPPTPPKKQGNMHRPPPQNPQDCTTLTDSDDRPPTDCSKEEDAEGAKGEIEVVQPPKVNEEYRAAERLVALVHKEIIFALDNTSPAKIIKRVEDASIDEIFVMGQMRDIPGWDSLPPVLRRKMVLNEATNKPIEEFRQIVASCAERLMSAVKSWDDATCDALAEHHKDEFDRVQLEKDAELEGGVIADSRQLLLTYYDFPFRRKQVKLWQQQHDHA